MGYLTVGAPLSHEETAKLANRIRLLGTLEVLRCYLNNHDRKDATRWFGHECEYMLIHLDPAARSARLVPCAPLLLEKIPVPLEHDAGQFIFMPEFGAFMVEGTPGTPWILDKDNTTEVFEWFSGARRHIRLGLERLGITDVHPFTLTSFPLLGTPDSVFEHPMIKPPQQPVMLSEFCGDVLVNPHPRFVTLARNIRLRRGKKVHIKSPPFVQNACIIPPGASARVAPATGAPPTKAPAADPHSPLAPRAVEGTAAATDEKLVLGSRTGVNLSFDFRKEAEAALSSAFLDPANHIGDADLRREIDSVIASSDVRNQDKIPVVAAANHDPIYMDAMAFGMGMCCLQETFSCIDELEARYLYDQLAVLSPLFLALTAATAVFKGTMSSHTTRWRVLSQSVDDRRDDELERVPFSRFSTASLFVSLDPYLLAHYKRLNDVLVPSRPDVYDACVSAGMDRVIARHFSAILSRDPLVAFEQDLDAVDIHSTDEHFESFQSTNWNTVRLKPPPLKGSGYPIPWRVEFRCCEAQLRDKESAGLACAIALLVRVMLKERWNLYMPMSLVHENMEASDSQDAITNHKFHFVTDLSRGSGEVGRYTLREIFFDEDKLGLFARCATHLAHELSSGALSQQSYDLQIDYLNVLKHRAYGASATNSQEIRDYVLGHHEYRGDGVVTPHVVHDMLDAILKSN
ncbi:glutamate-cysteine ligase catalytic subunit, putative [Babesia bigemina]|uniref:Glutamate--cysteine ligase n=1 Tax=Babesia bigemina TaxID=5866 RepID=A0A061D412_BABBI|nr:glutamate-cysteine ligase catalytic subunit, putative [Babesia bigemina]CDR95476.1 glutamate-cysteine ligase catalytic subunit, putative [Babesia bigemina]|eukprot:XP_012767662.1 glutamate-cysteine ligase catalytic subunit, putative [Babesia bigemina]